MKIRCSAVCRSIPLPRACEPPAHPVDQVAAFLDGELHTLDVFIHGGLELFHGGHRLIGQQVIDKHQAAVIREVGEQSDQFLPLILPLLVDVKVRHHHQRPLRHHGQSLHHLGKSLDCQVLSIQAVIVEGLKASGHQLFPQLLQVVLPRR